MGNPGLNGGDAENGKEEGGKYYVNSHGHYTEVSKEYYDFSLIHARSVWVTHPVAIFAFIWYYLRRRPVIQPVSSSGPIKMNVQFTERGGARLDDFNATWPFATLSADVQAIKLTCLRVEYIFPKHSICRLIKHKAFLSVGLRIEHTEQSYPQFVVFWTYDFPKLKAQLENLNYEITA
jgi:hypothetical protein